MEEEYSGLQAIVDLCLLAESNKNISTANHLREVYGSFKDTYKETNSISDSLGAAMRYDLAITAARFTHNLSKVYHKIPKKLMPSFIDDNSLIGISADVLNRVDLERI